jgi:hypothetical protein
MGQGHPETNTDSKRIAWRKEKGKCMLGHHLEARRKLRGMGKFTLILITIHNFKILLP